MNRGHLRQPRVSITYDREISGAVELRELPFVVGVLADLSRQREARSRSLPDRAFVTIDCDNFDSVLSHLQPHLRLVVPNEIENAGALELDLTFSSIGDFEPEAIVQRLPALKTATGEHATASGLLSRQMDRILHAPEFQETEAAWRGLHYLVMQSDPNPMLMIRVLDATKQELLHDFRRAADLNGSTLFKLVSEEVVYEQPFGLLIGDYQFSAEPEDLDLLEKISAVAARAHAPFIAAAGRPMFGMKDFKEGLGSLDLGSFLARPVYIQWLAFRQSSDSLYAGLALPRIMLRAPYGQRQGPQLSFPYEEDTEDGRHLLWGSPAYAFGASVTRAFARHGWWAHLRGVEGGGRVEGLPVWVGRGEADEAGRRSTEISVTDREEKELADLGFIPIVQMKNGDFPVIFSAPSCHQPPRFGPDLVRTNARLSCQLPYILEASRFMHYIKAIAKDKLSAFATPDGFERLLNDWISRYVLANSDASPTAKVRFPLSAARIDVVEQAGKPGGYTVVALLRTHSELDEIAVSLRIEFELPTSTGPPDSAPAPHPPAAEGPPSSATPPQPGEFTQMFQSPLPGPVPPAEGPARPPPVAAGEFTRIMGTPAPAPQESPMSAPPSVSEDPSTTAPRPRPFLWLRRQIDRFHVHRSADLPRGSSADNVNLSLTAPASLAIGQVHELRFWAHVEAQTATVMSRALSALGVLDFRRMLFKTEGPFRVSRGTVLEISVSIESLVLVDRCKTIMWSGEIGCAAFLVSVPTQCSLGSKPGTASVRIAGIEIARISFVLEVGVHSSRTGRVQTNLKRHKNAFASYASEDREAVLARIQGIQKAAPTLRVFVDVMNLRSGEDWERKLYEVIAQSDVFYLFWCRHARKSDWVEKEWRCAYQSKGIDFIDPVPLESPFSAPPPPELRKKHFNEPILAHISNSDHPDITGEGGSG